MTKSSSAVLSYLSSFVFSHYPPRHPSVFPCVLSPRFCVKPTFLFPCLVHICGFVICLVISCGVSFQLIPCSAPCLSPQSVWFHCPLFWQLCQVRQTQRHDRGDKTMLSTASRLLFLVSGLPSPVFF